MNWVIMASSIGKEKRRIRQYIWDLLEERGVASFPLPPHGRIPNFKGAREASLRLAETHVLREAQVVKVNPDAPQRYLRELLLRRGKRVLVPTPRLRGDFYLLDPGQISDFHYASSIKGFSTLAKRIPFEEVPEIDAIVVGSVAVSMRGHRVGKGEGYSELEYAILRTLGKVSGMTPVVTTIHDLQIIEEIPYEPYDVYVNLVCSPTACRQTLPDGENPKGILLEYLSKDKIDSTPLLKKFLLRFQK